MPPGERARKKSRPWSWYQWLILYAVEEGRVRWDGENWLETGSHRDHKVSMQIRRLAELGMVDDTAEPIAVTVLGLGVLRQYSLFEVVEKLQGK